MSYNISFWKTKKIDNLTVKLSDLKTLPDISVELMVDSTISAEGLSGGFELRGKLKDDVISVSKIRHSDDFSGWTWKDLKDLLRKSKGQLEAVQVWEGGDTITRLEVNDGDVIESEVEL